MAIQKDDKDMIGHLLRLPKRHWFRDRVAVEVKLLRDEMAQSDGLSSASWNQKLILQEAKRRGLIS